MALKQTRIALRFWNTWQHLTERNCGSAFLPMTNSRTVETGAMDVGLVPTVLGSQPIVFALVAHGGLHRPHRSIVCLLLGRPYVCQRQQTALIFHAFKLQHQELWARNRHPTVLVSCLIAARSGHDRLARRAKAIIRFISLRAYWRRRTELRILDYVNI